MFMDIQIGFVIEQPIDHMGGFMRRPRDDFGAIGVQLIGNVGVEHQARLGAILGIDLGGVAPWAAHRKALSIRRGGRPISQLAENGRR
jgi:hypothetical protein